MSDSRSSRTRIDRFVVAAIVAAALSLLAAACVPGGGDGAARDLDGPARADSGDSGGGSNDGSGGGIGSIPTSMDFGSGPDIEGVTPPDDTPIEISADITAGQLDNGLHYYIVENDAPGGQVELLMAVDAGSAQQPVPDSGNAHFLEHMMFNGTEEFPVNELDAVLRGLGVEIGPDLNAYTSFDETVYQMSMPTIEDANLELGLRVLAQWAGAATINQADVEAERGVVREEHRLRNESGGAEINERLIEYYMENSGYEDHLPIGSPEEILATDAEELRAFYDDWYRPDNMAIIAVGDIDTGTVERLIKQELSSLTDRGSSPPRTPVETGPITEPIVEVLTAEGGPEPSISLDYLWPTWDPSTIGGQRMLLADELIASMLRAHLDEQSADPSLDIIRPFVGLAPVARSRRLLGMNVAADDYRQGPADLMRAMRSVELNGFSQRHLDQARQQASAAIDQTVAAEPSKQDFQYAEEITDHFLTGAPLEDIEAWASRTSDQIGSFTLDELNRIFRWEMSITAPILALLGSDPAALPSQAELEAAVAEGLAGELLADVDATDIDRLVARPDGPDPASQDEFFDRFDGTYRWDFDNGVTVLFWNSTIASNQVDVLAVGGAGRQDLSGRESSLADLAVGAVTSSGVAGVNQVTLERYLSDRQVFVAPFVDTRFQGLSASAAADDVEVLFELLNAYLTAPGIDAGGLAEARNQVEAQLRAVETDPALASYAAEREARFESTPNLFVLPTAEEVDSVTAAELLSIYESRFGEADEFVFLVAGDIDRGDLGAVVVDYLGSLPGGGDSGGPTEAPAGRYPTGPIRLQVGAGLNDSGAGFDRVFVSTQDLSIRDRLTAELVAGIINDRLFNRVREELGASYGGGNATINSGYLNSGDTSFEISVNGNPDRLDEIMAAVDEELAVLLTDGPSAADLAEAKAVLGNDLQFFTNFDLLEGLLTGYLDGTSSNPFADPSAVAGIDAADVSTTARRLMADENLIEVTRRPGGG